MADEAVVLSVADVPARQVRIGQGFYINFGVYYTITEGAFRVSDLSGDIYRVGDCGVPTERPWPAA